MNKTIAFTTTAITGDPSDDEDVAWVYLPSVRTTDATEHTYLTLSRMLSDDDGYYIERDDQALGGYGGIAAVTLSPTLLHVTLSAIGQEHLGGIESVRVSLNVSSSEKQLLHDALKAIFAGTELLQVSSHFGQN